MNWPIVSQRDRHTLAAGAVVIAFLVVMSRGVPALRRWQADARTSATQLAAEAARAEASVSAHAATQESLLVRRARLAELDTAWLEGDSPATAAASLADLLAEAATVAEAQLTAVQVQPGVAASRGSAAGAVSRVAARASLTGDLETLVLFLATLESGPTLVSVRELSVTQPERELRLDQNESLRAEVVVEGLTRTARGRRRGGTSK
jgi:hypothetical protein